VWFDRTPASSIDRFAKIAISGSGAVIVDLEDTVAEQDNVTVREVWN
jgi:citrate lyase beta subunit